MDVDLNESFRAPPDYNPPKDTELDGNTQFPNLNSIAFRNQQHDNGINMLPFYELLEANQDQTTILLATNSYTQRTWNSNVFGYGCFSDIGRVDASTIKLSFDSNLTGVRFVDKSMVVFTTASGTIQLWSTQSAVRQKNGYSLFQVAKKSEHFGSITGFCIIGKKKAVTGSMDGCLKVWDLEPCDLVSERTYRNAHQQMITDISIKPQSEDIFATTSRDRNLSIWDIRSAFPMVNVCKNVDFANTACLWLRNDGIEKLYLGDDNGTIHVYDPRNLNNSLMTKKLFDRPIYKFQLNPDGKLLCVLGQTNTLTVIDTGPQADTIYTDSTANDYVRDICWKMSDSKTFCSIGWNKNVARHTIK